jgi:hypothetical protein
MAAGDHTHGVYRFTPSEALIDQLDQLFAGEAQ